MTSFQSDIKRGKIGEQIFKEDFLNFLGVHYIDVTNNQSFQVIDVDYSTPMGCYEIKTNYMDNRELIIEEYTNINEDLCPISLGWFYKTKASLIVFVSKKTRTMIFLPFTDEFKNYYQAVVAPKTKLIRNKVTKGYNGTSWQSAFRKVPLELINGYYSFFKKIHEKK